MTLDIIQFETFISNFTGSSYTVPTAVKGRFEYYLELYLFQLRETRLFNFDNPKISTTIRYSIPFCKLSYLVTPIWHTINKVEKLNIKTGNATELIEFKDYYTETVNITSHEYIHALNFKCLSCICECEKIVVTGNYGIDLPDILIKNLFLIIYNNLGTINPLGGDSCCANIKSKSSGEGTVTFYDKQKLSTNILKNADNILSYPIISNLILKYKKHFVSIC